MRTTLENALYWIKNGQVTIDLTGKTIDDEGAKALAAALEKSKAMTTLNLRDNYIGNEGAKALAAALENNTSLRNLNLSYNNIGDEGFKALAVVLGKNVPLNTLNMYGNSIGDEGIKAFVVVLERSVSLTGLNLSFDLYTVKGCDGSFTIQAARERGKINFLLFAFLSTVLSGCKRVCTAAAHFIWRDGNTELSHLVASFLIG